MRLLRLATLTTTLCIVITRNLFDFPRQGRMAHLMTVHVNNKTCPQESLLSSLSDTVASRDEDKIKLCKEICLETDNCRAFSILFRVEGVTQCDIFSSCSETVLPDRDIIVRSVTGLVTRGRNTESAPPFGHQPDIRKGNVGKTPRALKLVEEEPREEEDILELKSNSKEGLKKHGRTEYTYDNNVPRTRCDRFLQRSCPFIMKNIISFEYSKGIHECEAKCRNLNNCLAFTYHRQGVGGLESSGPCVLYAECKPQHSVWCHGCVTIIVDGCQDQAVESGGESVIEVEKDQTKEVVVLLGGLANDHVGHVEVIGSDYQSCHHHVQDLPDPKTGSVSGVLGGLLLVCGGKERHLLIPSDKCITADIGTGIWADGPKMNSARDSGASANLDDMIIVSGGWDGENILDSVEIINSDELNWQEVDGWRMTEPRYRHCSATFGDSLIIVGGYPTFEIVEVLSLDQQPWRGWRQFSPMTQGRMSHGCTVTRVGKQSVIVVSGGVDRQGQILDSVEVLHLDMLKTGNEAQNWFQLPSLLQTRKDHIMTIMGGSLLVIGGDTILHQLVSEVERLELFNGDAKNWKWNSSRRMISPRTSLTFAKMSKNICIS